MCLQKARKRKAKERKMSKAYKITPAVFPRDKQAVANLFTAYTNSLGIDLTFQDYQTELNSLPGKYSVDRGGCLLVARVDTDPDTSLAKDELENEDGEEAVNEEDDGQLIGCVAYRALPSLPEPDAATDSNEIAEKGRKGYCEMKRLYLTPEARGTGIGTKLIEAIIQHAKSTQLYSGMKLDNLPSMESARVLYRRFEFVEIEKYYETPFEGTIFMGLDF